MASLPIAPTHCHSQSESLFSRTLRLVGTALLMLQAVVLVAMAALAVLEGDTTYRLANGLFLCTNIALLACTAWSFRNAAVATRWLFLPCIASFVALFFTGYAHSVESVTLTSAVGTHLYNPILALAGLLFMCMVLSRFLRWSATKSACNCG